MRLVYTNHITALAVYVILNTLRSHPPDGNLLFTATNTLPSTEVVSAVHVLSQSKISHFDSAMQVNP